MHEITRTLETIDCDEPRAASESLPLVFDGLRKLAARKRAQERLGRTLGPTALVHQAWMRLTEGGKEGSPRTSHRD
jgi:ECF sigma factor